MPCAAARQEHDEGIVIKDWKKERVVVKVEDTAALWSVGTSCAWVVACVDKAAGYEVHENGLCQRPINSRVVLTILIKSNSYEQCIIDQYGKRLKTGLSSSEQKREQPEYRLSNGGAALIVVELKLSRRVFELM
jgi:hypothetical protein